MQRQEHSAIGPSQPVPATPPIDGASGADWPTHRQRSLGQSTGGGEACGSFLEYLVNWHELQETRSLLLVCERQQSTAQLSLHLSDEERRRAAYLAKLRYLQSRLTAFEGQQQPQPLPPATPDVVASRTSTAAAAPTMKLTPSTHQLAQLERDREIQRRRRRGRAPPPEMAAAAEPLRGRALAGGGGGGGHAPSVSPAAAATASERSAPTPPQQQQPLSRTPPPHPPPLPELATRSAGFYKLGFPPGDRWATAPPLDGRLDGQRASLQRLHHRHQHHHHHGNGGRTSAAAAAGTYLDGQARRLLRVTGPSGPSAAAAAAAAALRGDHERTFLQPRNPVNSPEPVATEAELHQQARLHQHQHPASDYAYY